MIIELNSTYSFEYFNSETNEWENKVGKAIIASDEYKTYLLGTILYNRFGKNEHLRNIKKLTNEN